MVLVICLSSLTGCWRSPTPGLETTGPPADTAQVPSTYPSPIPPPPVFRAYPSPDPESQTRIATLWPRVTRTIAPPGPVEETRLQELKDYAAINLQSNGKIYKFNVGEHFSMFLDDEKYPRGQLKVECEHAGILGSRMGANPGGPRFYPIPFEAVEPGICILKNGDFTVTIIVIGATFTPLPTRLPGTPYFLPKLPI